MMVNGDEIIDYAAVLGMDPDYDPTASHNNDIAMLAVLDGFDFSSPGVGPACLPQENQVSIY